MPYQPTMRLWARTAVIQDDRSCWICSGAGNNSGYQTIACGPGLGQRMAHWYAWWLVAGPPPPGFVVCHDCPDGDDRSCVRNDTPGWKEINGILRPKFGHLWAGTPAENTADMFEKGRGMIGDRHTARTDPSYLPRGEAHVNSKLTVEKVRDIRSRRAVGEPVRVLALANGVSRSTIENVLSGRVWGHVK